MAKRVTVVVSQGQSANPVKRHIEEEIVTRLLMERGVEVTVIPHLYDLAPDGTGMLCLRGIAGDVIVLSWLYPRAAHWTLSRNGIKGREGKVLLKSPGDETDEDDDEGDSDADEGQNSAAASGASFGELPNRTIYCIDLRGYEQSKPFLDEVRRIISEATVQTIGLTGLFAAPPGPAATGPIAVSPPSVGQYAAQDALSSHAEPAAAVRIEEAAARRWYPVIDYSRCTNCMECIDFCLFGVYGLDAAQNILIEQPDNCRKGCPACSRVCPENAIIFPQHKTPAIAGSADGVAGGLKIDLSKLFGAPDAVEVAAMERDVELVAVGRDAVGLSVGIPKRQTGQPSAPKDNLDNLMDQLDSLDF